MPWCSFSPAAGAALTWALPRPPALPGAALIPRVRRCFARALRGQPGRQLCLAAPAKAHQRHQQHTGTAGRDTAHSYSLQYLRGAVPLRPWVQPAPCCLPGRGSGASAQAQGAGTAQLPGTAPHLQPQPALPRAQRSCGGTRQGGAGVSSRKPKPGAVPALCENQAQSKVSNGQRKRPQNSQDLRLSSPSHQFKQCMVRAWQGSSTAASALQSGGKARLCPLHWEYCSAELLDHPSAHSGLAASRPHSLGLGSMSSRI